MMRACYALRGILAIGPPCGRAVRVSAEGGFPKRTNLRGRERRQPCSHQ